MHVTPSEYDIERTRARDSKYGVKTLFKGADYLRHNRPDKDQDIVQLVTTLSVQLKEKMQEREERDTTSRSPSKIIVG